MFRVILTIAVVLAFLVIVVSNAVSPSSRADTPLAVCSTIRERKVCNVEADAYASEDYLWIGRFAACAPLPVRAVAPIVTDGYTVRMIIWCGP